ncbi:MAG: glycosyltransferase family 4 protein [Saprospiraceae bacterium]|nr:glycosyltransferase family 4 protein [Saprospiraceae bacterium]
MTIIHLVLGKANPERMNGVNKVAYQLAKTQWELGHEVVLWGIANDLEHNYPERPFKTELFQQSGNKLRLDQRLREAVMALPKTAVVHVHGAFIPEFYLLTRLLRKQGIGYVLTSHGAFSSIAMQKSGWRKRLYFSLLENTVVNDANAVQLLGDLEYRSLDELAEIEHKVLIPNGMDLSELPEIADRPTNPALGFGFCGRLDIYYKGLDLLLPAFALFLQKGHEAKLEIIGDSPDRPKLELMAQELGIAQHVIFYGAKFGDEKFRLMARADVFVHTSRSEGFPMAVLEAAALGLPCLTSEGTNINRYIKQYEAGIPMDGPLKVELICAAMETAAKKFKDDKLRPLGLNARRMVREAFDWRKISEELVAVYAGSAKK